ncbi:MAG: putative ABC transport system permease protein [Motiliproteus sp.]|jgi:putative ABC transport system permease protein
MTLVDQLRFTAQVLARQRWRTALLLLTIILGVASVVVLTSVGEGARRYVAGEFSALGQQILVVLPGKTETRGAAPPLYGTSPRDLTLEDANALARIGTLRRIAPVIAGMARVSYEGVAREVITLGTTPDFFPLRNLTIGLGKPLPASAVDTASPTLVLGAELKQALFGNRNPLNRWLRIGERRFRVVGVLEERGESLGLDMRDMAIIPVRSAEQLFNSAGLFRILLELRQVDQLETARQQILELIRLRHYGEEDVTLISQDSILSSFDNVLSILTLGVAAIAAISLLVAGILIMNISLISVSQRQREIGLLKALGAPASLVRALFLHEALLLTGSGALIGIAAGELTVALALQLLPNFPFFAPLWAELSAILIAVGSGLLFSWWPATRAAKLDPIQAMRGVSGGHQ